MVLPDKTFNHNMNNQPGDDFVIVCNESLYNLSTTSDYIRSVAKDDEVWIYSIDVANLDTQNHLNPYLSVEKNEKELRKYVNVELLSSSDNTYEGVIRINIHWNDDDEVEKYSDNYPNSLKLDHFSDKHDLDNKYMDINMLDLIQKHSITSPKIVFYSKNRDTYTSLLQYGRDIDEVEMIFFIKSGFGLYVSTENLIIDKQINLNNIEKLDIFYKFA